MAVAYTGPNDNKLGGYINVFVEFSAALNQKKEIEMQVAEPKAMSSAVEKLCATPRGLPFHSEQAWMFSSHNMACYLQEHADSGTGLSPNKAALMAAGRLDWLLRETRPTLSGVFSERDFSIRPLRRPWYRNR